MARSRLQTKMATTAPSGEAKWDRYEAAVEVLSEVVSGGLPVWNSRSFTYVGSTNNVNVVTYKLNNVSVATVTYTYVAAGLADDDDVLTETLALT